VLAGAGDGQMSRDMTKRKVDEEAIQCSHRHNEEDEEFGWRLFDDGLLRFAFSLSLFGPIWTRIPTACMAHSVAMKIALFFCF
jgi:hypothetical protein